MSAFRPTRSSPPVRAPLDLSQSISAASLGTSRTSAPVPELTGLSQEDVQLLDAIIARAGDAATTFLTVFKAYNDILQERGLDPHEVVYYGKLLKLGTLKGRNWADKWDMVKTQYGYASPGRAGPSAERQRPPPPPPPPPAAVPASRRPIGGLRPAAQILRDDDSFTVHSHEHDSVSEDADADHQPPVRSTPYVHPALARARARDHRQPTPSDATSSNSLGLDFGDSASAAPVHRRYARPSPRPVSDASDDTTTDVFAAAPPSTTPPSYRAAARDLLIGRQSVEPPVRAKALYAKPAAIPQKARVIDDDDAWKKIRMAQNEKDADEYYRLRLMERCWDVWKEGLNWIITTHEQAHEARGNVLVHVFFNRWRDRVEYQQRRFDDVGIVADRRRLKAGFSTWRKRLVSKQHANWRESMRSKMKVVRKQQELRLRKDAWAKWRQSYRSHLSDQHYNARLILRAYQRWKQKLIASDDLEDLADQVIENRLARVAEDCWNRWRVSAQHRSAEQALSQRVGLRLKRQVLIRWQKQMHDLYAADEYYNLCLLKSTVRKWKSAITGVRQLERRADRQVARQDDVLLRAVARVWKARARGHLLQRVRAARLLKNTWAAWKDRLEHQRRQEELALQFSSQSSHLAVSSFQRWRKVLATHRNANEFAVQRHSALLSQRMMLIWRIRWHEQLKLAKKARLMETYFIMRRSLNKMHLVFSERQLEHKLDQFNARRTATIFQAWSRTAHRRRSLRLAEEQVETAVAHRVLRGALTHWTNRVIEIKLSEIETKQRREVRLLMNIYDKWKRVHSRVQSLESLMLSDRAVKEEDLTRRLFQHWLATTRASQHRRLLLKRLEDEKQLTLTIGAWERWRERYKEEQLRPIEYQFLFEAHKNDLRNAMNRWKSRTKSVPAIHFDATRIKSKVWKVWVEQMPRAQLAKKAREVDRKNTLSRHLENWLQAYRTKITRKAVDRARLLRLPTASSTPRPMLPTRSDPAAYRNLFPPRRTVLPERRSSPSPPPRRVPLPERRSNPSPPPRRTPLPLPDRKSSPSPPPPPLASTRPFLSRKPLFPSRTRSEASPPRAPPTRDSSPARSSIAPRPRRAFPSAPPSATEEPSKLWLELREVRNRSRPPSEFSRGRRSP